MAGHWEGNGQDGYWVEDPTPVAAIPVPKTSATSASSFDPAAMGLTPAMTGSNNNYGQNYDPNASQGIQIGWQKYLGDGKTQNYDMQGNDLGIVTNPSGWVGFRDTLVKPVGSMVASALLPGYINPLLTGAGLSPLAASIGTGAITGGTVGGLTGGDPLKGALLGGIGGGLSEYFSPSMGTDPATSAAWSNGSPGLGLDTVSAVGGTPDVFGGGTEFTSFTPSAVDLANSAQNTFRASEIAAQNAGQGALNAAGYPVMPGAETNPTDQRLANGIQTSPGAPELTNGPLSQLNPTDQRLENGTQTSPGAPELTNGPLTQTELNPTDQRLANGTQISPGSDAMPAAPMVPTKSNNPFVNPDGSYNWRNIIAAIGAGSGILGAATTTPGTIKSLSDLVAGLSPVGGSNTGSSGGMKTLAELGANMGGGQGVSQIHTSAPSGIRSIADMLGGGSSSGSGFLPSGSFLAGNQLSRSYAANMPSTIQAKRRYAEGGEVDGALSQARPFAGFVQGEGGGQEDNIDAKLSPGEYVWDAESVSMLGDGNNSEGARQLDEMRAALRAHKRSAPDNQIAPPARGPLSYMGGQNG